jgi:peroxiredoxin Q/BCP|tara:strand:- start:338 stop:811 length:474 start_codon:yes stop_codon:yes gene_type:complete
MPIPKLNNKAPIFKGECTGNKTISLSELKGKNVVLYFYPKDSTPGCTTEGQDFRDLKGQFTRANTIIFGLSRESIKSHENFKTKEKFNFDLISDPDEIICNQYDVIKEKSMYGKKYMGIERSTFLIDSKGKLIQEWRKVKVTGHASEVLDAAKKLKN